MDNAVTQSPQVTFPDMGADICEFVCSFRDLKVQRNGALIVTFVVPLVEKYKALAVTNFPGMVIRLKATREVVAYSDAIVAEAKDLGLMNDEFAPDNG